MFNKDELVSKLRKGSCVVSFTKVNGDKRVMTCTLNSKLIPAEFAPKNEPKPDPTPEKAKAMKESNVVPVFDTLAMGWRSFKAENVFDFKSGENI